MSDIENTPEEIDGNDVDWKSTAEALQAELAQRQEYPRDADQGDFIVLGPDIFTGKPGTPGENIISWKGQNYVPQKVVDLQPKDLKKYDVGELVEVQKNGNWLPGRISSKQAGQLNVDTERGPVPVMSYHVIRKAQQNG